MCSKYGNARRAAKRRNWANRIAAGKVMKGGMHEKIKQDTKPGPSCRFERARTLWRKKSKTARPIPSPFFHFGFTRGGGAPRSVRSCAVGS